MSERPVLGLLARALVCAAALLAVGCTQVGYSAAYWVGMPFLYRHAELAPDHVILDVPYRLDSGADPNKHRLDLFLPVDPEHSPYRKAHGFPVVVFVHGGGWTSGDRALEAGYADVYRNIGRFFAARGIGVAVVSYRLQPAVTWREQVDDVARAVAWVRAHMPAYGADPDALFLMGHSAGGHLVARVALDRDTLHGAGVPPESICGVIPVSGAALDLADEATYAAGADPDYYRARFAVGGSDPDWQRDASAVSFVRPDAPPFLILYAEGESAALIRQAHRLHEALREAGAASELVAVPGEGHQRIVLTLSRADKTATPAILRFVRDAQCGEATRSADAPSDASPIRHTTLTD